MLKLKEGFKIAPETVWASQRVVRSVDGQVFATWASNGLINVLPRSGVLGCACSSVKFAHEYLLACDSESPWREVADADELTAAAEGEGPAIEEDAETCRAHRASLHRIQVADAPMNMCRCVQVPIEPPAPRLCATDRLEAAGFIARLCDERVAFYSPAYRGLTVHIKPTRLAGHFRAEMLSATGDESPGLNAALESLLSKTVGAVTVAQILGAQP
jgi:hypothetical protein